jgi:hypothetical protein
MGDLSIVLMTEAREESPQGAEPIESNPGARTYLAAGPSLLAIYLRRPGVTLSLQFNLALKCI